MASMDMQYYYGLNSSKSKTKTKTPVEKITTHSYRRYPYKHYSLGSKPKYSSTILDERIANALDLLNNNPELNDKKIKIIESKIKDYTNKKNNLYLEPNESNSKQKTTKITFAQVTKKGGKKTRNNKKRTKRNNKAKGTKRNRH